MGVRSTHSLKSYNNKTDGHLLEYFRQNFGAGGGGTNKPPDTGLTATGGVISDYTDPDGSIYRAHVFTSSGTFDVTTLATGAVPNALDYLVVAGGGGGGNDNAGGGGAGGLRSIVQGF